MVQSESADMFKRCNDFHQSLLVTLFDIDLQLIELVHFFILDHFHQLFIADVVWFEDELLEWIFEVVWCILESEA